MKTVAKNPGLFNGRTAAFNWQENTVRGQEATEDNGDLKDNYNIVALRTNMEEAVVTGVLGDGMIWYPYKWCPDENDENYPNCYSIGPWVECLVFMRCVCCVLPTPPPHLFLFFNECYFQTVMLVNL